MGDVDQQRLWVGAPDDDGCQDFWFDPNEGGTEYVRADLYETLTAERDALRAQVAEMMEDRGRAALNLRDKMRTAYKAGYDTRKIGGRLNEGWAVFAPTIPDLR